MAYDPHSDKAGEHPDYHNEMLVVGKGRLVKVRFTDQEVPNVTWIWIATGNCHACKYYQPPDGGNQPDCMNPAVPKDKFWGTYLYTNTCPSYEPGQRDPERVDILDVIKAIGLVRGKPGQGIEIIHDLPWSIRAAQKAHEEQSAFLDMARLADYVKRGGKNVGGEYVDLSDDLEGPTPMWECFKPGGVLEGANVPTINITHHPAAGPTPGHEPQT